MGFKEVTPVLKEPKIGKVRFSTRINKAGMAVATVIVPAPVLSDLGWPNGQPVKLLIGDGPDLGRLRLHPAEKAAAKFTAFGRGGGADQSRQFRRFAAKGRHPGECRSQLHGRPGIALSRNRGAGADRRGLQVRDAVTRQ